MQLQTPDYSHLIATELKLKPVQVQRTLHLFTDGNTIPFIARYRKEQTGELDENQLRSIAGRYESFRTLHERKSEVLRLVQEQGVFEDDAALETFVEALSKAVSVTEVNDLYRPYRPKRKTRASVARGQGLEPLLTWILKTENLDRDESDIRRYASGFVSAKTGVTNEGMALEGAADIFAERVADDAGSRKRIRSLTMAQGRLHSSATDAKSDSVYAMYYDYEEPLGRILPHRVLAMNRGERDGYLKITMKAPEPEILDYLLKKHLGPLAPRYHQQRAEPSYVRRLLENTVEDAYSRLIAPAIRREIRSGLTIKAEQHAIYIFGENLKNLLLQPPLRGRTVLGMDPAYRTGCKLAVVDPTGKLLQTAVVYPTPPECKVEEARQEMIHLLESFNINLVVIGNGTASRETESFAVETLHNYRDISGKTVPYAIVSEAGASVYSASKLAGEEFPQLDVAERSAVSIARRMQDPLAELVKIDPKSIGVGQYQHDVAQQELDQKLSTVVESTVNQVGVDVNTASTSLLSYVAGLNKTVARNIVTYRDENGRFETRRQLGKVPRLGPKTMEQCVGFLRIMEGLEPLDATPIHPESYVVVRMLLEEMHVVETFFQDADIRRETLRTLRRQELNGVAERLDVGEPTLRDILDALERPGRDPRDDVPPPVLRTDVLGLEDVRPGMVLTGTVRNVVDFGAFVDIGIKNDGLVHISQLTNRFTRHPMDVVSVGDTVRVRVLHVDVDKGRVALTMRDAEDGA